MKDILIAAAVAVITFAITNSSIIHSTCLIMTAIQPRENDYKKLTVIDLYREAMALTKARDVGDKELVEITQEDYEACLKYKCEKIDKIYLH